MKHHTQDCLETQAAFEPLLFGKRILCDCPNDIDEDYRVEIADGKYTAVVAHNGSVTFLRHHEPWPAADDLKHVGVVNNLVWELHDARKAHYGAGRQPWDDIIDAGWGAPFAAGNVPEVSAPRQGPRGEPGKGEVVFRPT